MPNVMMYVVALVDKRINMRWVRDHLGRRVHLSNQKSIDELGLEYTSEQQTLIECAQSLINLGIVKLALSFICLIIDELIIIKARWIGGKQREGEWALPWSSVCCCYHCWGGVIGMKYRNSIAYCCTILKK